MSYEKLKCGSRERKLATRGASKNLVSTKHAQPGRTVVSRQPERDLTFRADADDQSVEVPAQSPWWLYSALGRGAE